MARWNLERGFFRLTAAVSAVGVLVFLVAAGIASYNGIRRASFLARVRADPKYLALSAAEQATVMDRIHPDCDREFPVNEALGGMAVGGVGFGVVWILYFALRWIARGFGPKG